MKQKEELPPRTPFPLPVDASELPSIQKQRLLFPLKEQPSPFQHEIIRKLETNIAAAPIPDPKLLSDRIALPLLFPKDGLPPIRKRKPAKGNVLLPSKREEPRSLRKRVFYEIIRFPKP